MDKTEFIRKSLELTEEQWTALDELAYQFDSLAPTGPTAGEPSWRSFVKQVADSRFDIAKRIASVTVEYCNADDAMFGTDPDAIDDVDIPASLDKFDEMLMAALEKEYPAADISITGGINSHTSACWADGYQDHEHTISVEEILHNVWESWLWIVEKP